MEKHTEHVNCVVTRTEVDEISEIGLVDRPRSISVRAEGRGIDVEFSIRPADAPRVGDMVSVTLEWGDGE